MKKFILFFSIAVIAILLYNCDASYERRSKSATGWQYDKVENGGYQQVITEQEPVANAESYAHVEENKFFSAEEEPISTFSADVDRASYSNIRRFITYGQKPPADAVRIEEMINYFNYDYPQPQGNDPLKVITELAECPWNEGNQLLLVGMQGKNISTVNLPASNLAFLVDVSGSMSEDLPLVKSSLKLLTLQLRDQDRVAIVVYAGAAGCVLQSTPGNEKEKIINAIDALQAGGSTAGGEGIKLAYKIAEQNFIKDGNNRVILATDGDFNVGVSSENELETLVTEKRETGVFLTCLGFGMGNYQDSKMELMADKGNGNYSYIDNINEARKVLLNEFGGTMFTIAKDVKIQIQFNPKNVQAYRLIGYENRMLKKEDFENDKKDAGEVGSGHMVTAIYEIIPVGVKSKFYTDEQGKKKMIDAPLDKIDAVDMGLVKLRYKKPADSVSVEIKQGINKSPLKFENASDNFRFASAVALSGMILKKSPYKGTGSLDFVVKTAASAKGKDDNGEKQEFITLAGKF